MNKRELAAAVAERTDLDAGTADRALEAALAVIGEQLAAGQKVSLNGFGVFEARQRAARTGRNPQTGEQLQIAATISPAFKPASALKQVVSGG